MIDLKQYGYIEDETPPIGLIPGRVMELQREQYTVITEQGEVTAVLKGSCTAKGNCKKGGYKK